MTKFLCISAIGGGHAFSTRKKSRKRKVTWFNPPFSVDVDTDVGREFLKLVDMHFPPGHTLHPILNRSTVKVSYRCLPNMGAQIAKHNQKVLKNSKVKTVKAPPECNCQKSKVQNCPLSGACNQDGVVYQATVATSDGQKESYVGLAKSFKARWRKHRDSMLIKDPENSTTLSRYYWEQLEGGSEPLT